MPIPGRVEAAITFLRLADWVRNPLPVFDGMKQEPRDLTQVEQKVEDAALAVLLDYFACKADFGDDPPRLSTEDKDRATAIVKAEEEATALKKRVAELEEKQSQRSR